MKKIICRRCGTEIDAALGECPVCGAVYYILPEETQAAPLWTVDEILSEAAAGTESKNAAPLTGHAKAPARSVSYPTSSSASSDNTNSRPTPTTQGANPPPPPVRPSGVAGGAAARPTPHPKQSVSGTYRPTNGVRSPFGETSRPTGEAERRRAAIEQDEAYMQHKRRGLDNRTRGFIVGAVALLAVLTVIICSMSGAFDFDKNSDARYMPDLIGLTAESAESILDSLGMKLEVSLVYESSSEPEGTVIAQSAKADKKLSKRDHITLTISKGDIITEQQTETPAAAVQVPDLTGKTYDEARDLLLSMGLTISKTEGVYSDSVELDRIVFQSPERGAEITAGSMVVVTLSTGPAPTEEPAVHTISVTAGKGGTVSPRGQVEVTDGGSETFTITPDDGYEIGEVKIDGTDVGPVESYTFTNVTSDHSIYVVFRLAPEETDEPAEIPTETPTEPPTEAPSEMPSEVPTEAPSEIPTGEPPLTDNAPAEPTEPVTAPAE